MGEQDFKNILRNIGLTEKETQIYLFLAKYGALKTGEISRQTKTNKGEIYRILKALEEKGVVESTLDSPVRFSAVMFDKILDASIRAKHDEVASIEKAKNELLSYWKGIQRIQFEPLSPKLSVIKGDAKIFSKISQLIRETKSRFFAIFTFKDLLRANLFGFFDLYHEHPIKSKANFTFLTDLPPGNVKAIRDLISDLETSKLNFEGRTPNLGLRLFPRMAIKDQEEALFFIDRDTSTSRDEACIWTDSKSLIEAFTALFSDLWRNSSDIKKTLEEIESGEQTSNFEEISHSSSTMQNYENLLNSANNEVIILTSSNGLIDIFNKQDLFSNLRQRGITIKLMAPITTANSKVAKKLSRFSEVKHIPSADHITVLIDGTHVFQIQEPKSDKKPTPELGDIVYSKEAEYVKKIGIMLNNIWLTATPPSPQPVKSVIPPQLVAAPQEAVSRFTEKLKGSAPTGLPVARSVSGVAYIHPPIYLGIPTIFLRIFHYTKESAFGEGDVIEIDLALPMKSSRNYDLIPSAIANTNAKAVIPEKAVYSGSPAADNYFLVKENELRVVEQGNFLFGGWTFPIPLPPTKHSLPPGVLLIEGYGKPRHSKSIWPLPLGYRELCEFDALDAFVTFLDPFWKYGGPGTQGQIHKNQTMRMLPPT